MSADKFEEWAQSQGILQGWEVEYSDVKTAWLASRQAMAEELVAAIKSRAEDRVANFPELSFADGYRDGMLGATDIILAIIDKP